MKVVIQRVTSASVLIEGGEKREIGSGLVCLFGAGDGDDGSSLRKLAEKTANLRIFSDSEGRMNLSAVSLGLELLVIPNFTLFADTRKGLRPSFTGAAEPGIARVLYERFIELLGEYPLKSVKSGEFGAHMHVELCNDGPITIILDTREWER